MLSAQLTNLFQIANANDRVLECIATIEGLPAPADPQSNPDLKSNVDKEYYTNIDGCLKSKQALPC